MTYWVYILASKPGGTLYAGVTNDLAKRVYEHREGLVDGFTKRYGVKTLVYFEAHETIAAALQRGKDEVRRRGADNVNSRLTQLLTMLQQGGDRAAPPKEDNSGDRILIKSSGEIFFLKAEEIDWIEAEGDYMKFHVAGRAHLMRETMARLEARLDPKRFVRIHRSTIVNIDRLRKLSPSFAGEYAVVLHDGTKLKLSRGYHERIAAILKQSL